MNERIRELAEQAGAVYSNDHAVSLLDDEIEKFAELIVQECGVALTPTLRDMISRGQAFDLIKQHFGLE